MTNTDTDLAAAAKVYRTSMRSFEDIIGATRPFFDQLVRQAARVEALVNAEAPNAMRVDPIERVDGGVDRLRIHVGDAILTVLFTPEGIFVGAVANEKPIAIHQHGESLAFSRVSHLEQVAAPSPEREPRIAFAFDSADHDGSRLLTFDEVVAALLRGATERRERGTLELRKRLKQVYVP